MPYISLAVLIALLLLMIRGAFKGFSGELAHLAGLAACGGLIWFGYDPVQRSIAYVPQISEDASKFYAALAVFIIGALLFFIVAKIIRKIGEYIVPQPFNAVLGALVGAAKAILFISIIAGSVKLIRERIKEYTSEDIANPATNAMIGSWKEFILPDFRAAVDTLKSSDKQAKQTDGEEEQPDGKR